MNEAEFKAAFKRLDAMDKRVDAVIAHEQRGKRMPILDFKPRTLPPKPAPQPALREPGVGYEEIEIAPTIVYYDATPDECCATEDDMWANFREDYDEMVGMIRQMDNWGRKGRRRAA